MARKALCIGCNYSGQLSLNGCVNDCADHVQLAAGSLGIPATEIIVLADVAIPGINAELPTKHNILASIRWLTRGAQPGDMLYFSFSGHGTQVSSAGGEDGMDEAIVPGDYTQTNRVITGDELHTCLIKPLPEGVLLTCVFDCCHAGTILQLDACIDSTIGGTLKAGKQRYRCATRGFDLLLRNDSNRSFNCRALAPLFNYIYDPVIQAHLPDRGYGGPAVFCFSGCRDDQTSVETWLDGKPCGVLTHCLLKALHLGALDMTLDYKSVFLNIFATMTDLRRSIPHLRQYPQLSYVEKAAPENTTFCRPPAVGTGFIPAVPAAAPFFIGFQKSLDQEKKEGDMIQPADLIVSQAISHHLQLPGMWESPARNSAAGALTTSANTRRIQSVSPPREHKLMPESKLLTQIPKQIMFFNTESLPMEVPATHTSPHPISILTPSTNTPVKSPSTTSRSIVQAQASTLPSNRTVVPVNGNVATMIAPIASHRAELEASTPATPTVNVPRSVLAQLDQKICEMSLELAELQEAEKKQEEPSELSLMSKHLIVMRQILAEDLLRDHDKQNMELLEARKKMDIERDELMRAQAALELECESRLRELCSLGGAAAAADNDFQERIEQLTMDSARLRERVMEAESNAEREKIATREARDRLVETDGHLVIVKAELREVVNACQILQQRVQELEAAQIEESHTIEATHAKQKSVLSLKVQDLEQELANLQIINDGHVRQLKTARDTNDELGRELEASRRSESETARHSKALTTQIESLQERLRDVEEKHEKHVTQSMEQQQKLVMAECELETYKNAEDTHRTKHAVLQKKNEELEQTVVRLEGVCKQRSQEFTDSEARYVDMQERLNVKIESLEKRVRVAEDRNESQLQQNAEHQRRTSAIETELEKYKRADDAYNRKHEALQESKHALEKDVARLEDLSNKKSQEFTDQLAQMQHELNESRAQYGDVRRQSLNDTSRLAELLQKLKDSEARYAEAQERLKDSEARIVDAQRQLISGADEAKAQYAEVQQKLKRSEDRYADMEGRLKAKIEALEKRLRDAEDKNDKQSKQHEQLSEQLTQDFRGRLSEIQLKLDESRAQYGDVRRKSINDTERLAQMLQKLEDSEARYAEVEGRLKDSEARYAGLQARLIPVQKQVTDGKVPDLWNTNSPRDNKSLENKYESSAGRGSSRGSLYGDVVSSKSYLIGEFLLAETEPFIMKVREAVSNGSVALDCAMQVHVKCLGEEIQRLAESVRSGADMRAAVRDRIRQVSDDAERRSFVDKVEATLHELRAIKEELQIQHNLKQETLEQATQRLEFEVHRCEDDLALLHADSPLEDIPMNVLQMLVDVYESHTITEWPDKNSPMHWAAEIGRRDVILLVIAKGGKNMLQWHNASGLTPLYYAQLGNHRFLIEWMSQVLKVNAPVHKHEPSSEFSGIPEIYTKILQKIHNKGWRSMAWKDNYTMLHWAASTGRTDVCQYLVTLDADPSARDSKGKSPIDIATDSGNAGLVSVLKDLRMRRRASRKSTSS